MRIFRSLSERYAKFKRRVSNKVKDQKKKKDTAETFTKRKVSQILNHAIVWVYLTYGLAYLGKTDIAENLSITVVKVIIYTFIPYLGKALFENVFKYGHIKIGKNPHVDEEIVVEKSSDNNTELTSTSTEGEVETGDSAG